MQPSVRGISEMSMLFKAPLRRKNTITMCKNDPRVFQEDGKGYRTICIKGSEN